MSKLYSPPQLNNPWRGIFILDICITAENIPMNESTTFNGAGKGAKNAGKKCKCLKLNHEDHEEKLATKGDREQEANALIA